MPSGGGQLGIILIPGLDTESGISRKTGERVVEKNLRKAVKLRLQQVFPCLLSMETSLQPISQSFHRLN